LSAQWRAVLTGGMARRAVDIACIIAQRLRHPMDVERAAAIAYAQSNLPVKLGWHPASVSMGYAGLALLFEQLERCRPGEGWELDAHRCLELAVCECDDVGLGLFGGLTGVAMVTWRLSQNGRRYSRLLSNLDDALLQDLPAHVAAVDAEPCGVPFAAFDVISGLTGTAAYLLLRADRPDFRQHLARVLNALLRLWEWVDGRPRWHTPSKFVNLDLKIQRQFPHGNVNCGVAHGIPGPLAVLSLASLEGIAEPGTHEAIEAIANWLVANRVDDAWGPSWPSVLRIAHIDHHRESETYALEKAEAPAHNAWCYGSAGVATALALASRALGVETYADVARDALRAIMARPSHERGIVSPTFCHGLAGLMQVFARFAQTVDGDEFAPEVEHIFRKLEEMFQPESLLGFRSYELEGRRVDQPGLLDGTPGVALALLAAGTAICPDWDRIFLLS
jgi:hypothetical protein